MLVARLLQIEMTASLALSTQPIMINSQRTYFFVPTLGANFAVYTWYVINLYKG